MDRTTPDDVSAISAKPLDPDLASFLRMITTFFGLHRACPFKVCRGADACATRNVVCYQALEEEMKPIVRSIKARHWEWAVAHGAELDVAPARQGDMQRLLAWEAAEIERIATGACGSDDGLTPYQLWLKNCVGREASSGLARGSHVAES